MSKGNEWPLPAFYFGVTIGKNLNEIAFQEISGLESQLETEEYREGGNNHVYHLPKGVKHGNITLKRGITSQNSPLIKWCRTLFENPFASKISTQNISIQLYDEKGNPCHSWECRNAYPVKWNADSFESKKNDVAIETFEFCCSRIVQLK